MYAADDFYYSPVAQVQMPSWSKGRVVLLADAGYCASPISGMGTTLAMTGAHNLAGSLYRYPHDHTAAFAAYEALMRPTVEKAQKLVPGAPGILYPQSAWTLWVMSVIMWLVTVSNLQSLLAGFAGPPAGEVPVEDFGFRTLQDGWSLDESYQKPKK
ncbi:hypothetical protein AMS68_002113 [Peltaster fructicola]|uniref:FAD-binding domain-containing protein n=1 Tax=Peltaster fructicola TaxID=286661 RepID=A0A6H0XPI4_9PEZI|nr:hypothetical protein AMS68_002113 [Peltaster fructicola]